MRFDCASAPATHKTFQHVELLYAKFSYNKNFTLFVARITRSVSSSLQIYVFIKNKPNLTTLCKTTF